jgi:O-antigen ligase
VSPVLLAIGAGILLLVWAALGAVRTLLLASYAALVGGSVVLVLTGEQSSVVQVGKLVPMGFLAVALLIRGTGRPRPPLEVVTLCVLTFLSVVWSADPALTVQRAAGLALLAIVAFWGFPRNWSSHGVTDTIGVMVLAGAAVAAASLAAIPFWANAFLRGRFEGILANPNALGFLLAPIIPLALYLRRGWLPLSPMAVALALSGSRGGLLAAALGLLVVAVMSGHRLRTLLVVAGIGAGVVLGLSRADVEIRPEGEPLFSLASGSGRVEAWQQVEHLIAERPIAGYGFGTTDENFRALAGPIAGFQGTHVSNGYLEVGFELGLAGLVLVGIMVLRGLADALRIRSALRAVLCGSIVAGAAEVVFESGITSAGGLFALSFWTVLGMARFAPANASRLSAARPNNGAEDHGASGGRSSVTRAVKMQAWM